MKGAHKEEERNRRIRQVIKSIIAVKKAGLELDEQALAMEVCEEHGVSERKAKEYIKMAKFYMSKENVKV